MPKKIIITGGLGYIGTELCKIYSGVSWHHQIIIIDNQEINLKLSCLNTFIELGHNNKLEKKIQNLKAFYNRAVRKNDIEKYKEVILQFENQVVAVKK